MNYTEILKSAPDKRLSVKVCYSFKFQYPCFIFWNVLWHQGDSARQIAECKQIAYEPKWAQMNVIYLIQVQSTSLIFNELNSSWMKFIQV